MRHHEIIEVRGIPLDEAVVRRTLAHRLLEAVSYEDVVTAFFAVDDLWDVMQAQWDQIEFGEDDDGGPLAYQIPRRGAGLPPELLPLVVQEYRETIDLARQRILPMAAMEAIPVTRRLHRLTDLTKPMGVHWSYGNNANRHTDHRGGHVAFAEVANGDVDWTTTLARACFWWAEEQEITPVAGSSLRLLRVDFSDGLMVQA